MAGETWRPLGQIFFVGTVLAVAVSLGAVLGWYLDGRFRTRPWLTVAGVLLGSAAGFRELWRTVKKLK